ncbi:sce7726 family protein [Myxococcus sp. MxC21-1]|uniref:sce7726 family protein n=1 Tax=Myxococcus sp. MxC21-1 TaxID=3041439 RepID=UPI00292E530A|nr:sce7726 family protein [Myxococcus sp. MxC21-1]WNZ64195.1 sce7726 family protein [Myxococcus sp. MxC21-1]
MAVVPLLVGWSAHDCILQEPPVTSLRDADIRQPLAQLAAREYPGAQVLHEVGLEYGLVRVDVATISPECPHAFEVKADADTLRRLPVQEMAYSAVFDRCTLVAGERHLERGQALVPAWWGVVLVRAEDGGVVLEEVRPAQDNPAPGPGATLRLMWRPEMLALLEASGAARGVRSASKGRLLARLIEALPPAELRARVRQVVSARGDWRLT